MINLVSVIPAEIQQILHHTLPVFILHGVFIFPDRPGKCIIQKGINVLIMIVERVPPDVAFPDQCRYGDFLKRHLLQHVREGFQYEVLCMVGQCCHLLCTVGLLLSPVLRFYPGVPFGRFGHGLMLDPCQDHIAMCIQKTYDQKKEHCQENFHCCYPFPCYAA